jgi:N-acetylated-alpha-linked acidic dipeptidase
VALSKVAGHTALRLADADVLPLRFSDFSDTLDRYVVDLHKSVDDARKATVAQHQLLDADAYALCPIRRDRSVRRCATPTSRRSNLAPLDAAMKRFEGEYEGLRFRVRGACRRRLPATPAQQGEIDSAIARMEQGLTDPDGLPGRGWYKHMIYAPGLLTGYDVKTVPGVREAIEQRRWDEANRYAGSRRA